jgi:hypothetical protein
LLYLQKVGIARSPLASKAKRKVTTVHEEQKSMCEKPFE